MLCRDREDEPCVLRGRGQCGVREVLSPDWLGPCAPDENPEAVRRAGGRTSPAILSPVACPRSLLTEGKQRPACTSRECKSRITEAQEARSERRGKPRRNRPTRS